MTPSKLAAFSVSCIVYLIFFIPYIKNPHRLKNIYENTDAAWYFLTHHPSDKILALFLDPSLNYGAPFRGYIANKMYIPVRLTAYYLDLPEVPFYLCFAAAMLAFFTAFQLPLVYELALKRINIQRRISLVEKLLFCVPMLIFWKGFVVTPLSNVPAAIFFMWGIYFYLKYSFDKKYLNIFLMGCFLIGACQIRGSYIIPVLLGIIILIIQHMPPPFKLSIIIKKVLVYIIAIFFVGAPQLYINYTYHNKIHPFPFPTVAYKGDPFNMYLHDIYESYLYGKVLPGSYRDPHALAMYSKAKKIPYRITSDTEYRKQVRKEPLFTTYYEYIEFVMRYPLDNFLLYYRSLFNGLDLKSNSPFGYPTKGNFYDNYYYRTFLNFTILFIAILCLYNALPLLRGNFYIVSSLCLIFSSILTHLPPHVEVCYFIILHILSYMLFCYTGVRAMFGKNIISYIKQYWFHYFAFMATCLLLSSTILGVLL